MTLKPNTDIPQPEAQEHNVSIINHIQYLIPAQTSYNLSI